MLEKMVDPVLQDLVNLCLKLGSPTADLAILGEGNASARLGEDRFYVKASGFSMSNIGPSGFSLVNFAPILEALDGPDLSDAQVRALLADSRAEPEKDPTPSVETFMHAYLLSLRGISFVGHTHPTPLLSLLSVEGCEQIARQRLFPDEIVCCGPATAFVPYVDPGLPLARAIKQSVEAFIDEFGMVPKTIWLQNHGLITPAKSVRDVESASFMAIKAARAWLGVLASGQAVRPLTQHAIDRIHTRPDEHYRQKLI
jgi:rhamnose utilization protein RhaD (predicted bifunctional aldolase and dehydrogenase)